MWWPSTKRRKVTDNDGPKSFPVVDVGGLENDPADDDTSVATTTLAASVEPKPKIANLILELPKQNAKDVMEALESIHELLGNPSEMEEWKECKNDIIWTCLVTSTVLRMQKWQTNEDILEICLKCFGTLTGTGFDWDESACVLVQSRGVEAIVNALQAFPDSLVIQNEGCWALMNTFFDLEKEPIYQAAHSFVEELNSLVLVPMKLFALEAHFQQTCCGLLNNLALDEGFHEALKKADAAEAVVKAMKNHSDHQKLKAWGLMALKNMFPHDEDEEEED